MLSSLKLESSNKHARRPGVRRDDKLMKRNAVLSPLNRLPRIRHRGGEAAVDREGLAVDVGRLVAGKEQSHRRQFVRLAGALRAD